MYTACPAKINLGLQIDGRLPNGYHTISSFFLPISLADILEIVPSANGQTRLHISGIDIPGNPDDNLILQLVRILSGLNILTAERAWDIYLHKQIPTGAGLGGGSSDVMAMLRLLEESERLHLPTEQKKAIAQQIGSDCVFFLQAVPAFVSGMGEDIIPLQMERAFWEKWQWVLIYPDIHISSAWAYRAYDQSGGIPSERKPLTSEVIQRPISEWKDLLINDFERVVFAHHPVLAELKSWLYAQGAVYASMSGSGSVVYGMFDKEHLDFASLRGQLDTAFGGRITTQVFGVAIHTPIV